MPRLDHRLTLRERIAPDQRQILLVVLQLINDVRQELGMPLLREADVTRIWQSQIQSVARPQ